MRVWIKGKFNEGCEERPVWVSIEYVCDADLVRLSRYGDMNYWAYLDSYDNYKEIKISKEEFHRLANIMIGDDNRGEIGAIMEEVGVGHTGINSSIDGLEVE